MWRFRGRDKNTLRAKLSEFSDISKSTSEEERKGKVTQKLLGRVISPDLGNGENNTSTS